jgi:hypothetical protein
MLDDVSDIATPAIEPRPRASASSKAAINYLIASGATAISVIETETGCTFRIGSKIDPPAAAIDVSATLTTTAFDRSSSRWLGISDLIAEPEGPSFISRTVARSRVDRLRS